MNNKGRFRGPFDPGGPLSGMGGQLRPLSELEQLRMKCQALEDMFQRQVEAPANIGIVQRIAPDRKKCIIIGGSGRVEVLMPAAKDLADAIRIGMSVRVNGNTGGIISIIDYEFASGNSMKVRSVLPDGRVMIDTPLGIGVAHGNGHKMRPGDRVLLDGPTGSVVVDVLPQEEQASSPFAFLGETGVDWSEIIGQEKAKDAVREAVEGPFLHADVYKRYGKKPMKGILLYGSPGNGKTMLGKAAARALGEIHGEKHEGAFLYVKGPEILSKFVGEPEAAIRQMFEAARVHKRKHGYPAVIFVDEADAILGKRPSSGQVHSFTEKTIVPQFLTEMDGLHENAALVLLATNRPDSLDPAVVRDGRVDRRVHVERPDRRTAGEILRQGLSKLPLADPGGLDLLSEFTLDRVFSNAHAFVEVRVEKKPDVHVFALQHIVSCAMLVGIVDKATSAAIKRETSGKGPEGITRDDLGSAIKLTVEEQRAIDHSQEFGEFISALREKVESVKAVDGGIIH